MSDRDRLGTPPEQPRRKVHFGVPEGYWSWSEAEQREWAHEAVKSLQERLRGLKVPESEQSLPETPEG